MNLRETFDRLGMPKHSDTIFSTLERGPSSVSSIAKTIRVHRPAIYRSLAALANKKLISQKTFGRRIFYVAESRSRIARLFEHTADEVAHLERSAPKNSAGSVRYFEGQSAVTAIFNDAVEHSRRGDTFYRYTSEKDLDEVNRLLPSDYRKRRDAKRLERLVISNPESGKRKKNRLERFIKFLGSEKEAFHQNAIQLIYGDRLAFIDLNTYKGFIIENATLASFQKSIFRALYKRL
jgi:sugar-specific transcriptional regulator TrmB